MASVRMKKPDRRKAILTAALEVISRTNYDKATTAAIAERAGINEALIYHHFKSKRELFLALLDYAPADDPPPLGRLPAGESVLIAESSRAGGFNGSVIALERGAIDP